MADEYAAGDEIQRQMMEAAGGSVVDPEKTRKTLQLAMEALHKQAESLRKLDYEAEEWVKCTACGERFLARLKATAKEVAQAMSYTGRVIDDIYRLSEFAVGRADSRPDVGVGQLLEYLSEEQLAEFSSWVQAGKAKRVESVPKGGTLQ